MQCPYLTNVFEVQVLKVQIIDETTGAFDSQTTITQQANEFGTCKKDGCAAWQDGHCVRK